MQGGLERLDTKLTVKQHNMQARTVNKVSCQAPGTSPLVPLMNDAGQVCNLHVWRSWVFDEFVPRCQTIFQQRSQTCSSYQRPLCLFQFYNMQLQGNSSSERFRLSDFVQTM